MGVLVFRFPFNIWRRFFLFNPHCQKWPKLSPYISICAPKTCWYAKMFATYILNTKYHISSFQHCHSWFWIYVCYIYTKCYSMSILRANSGMYHHRWQNLSRLFPIGYYLNDKYELTAVKADERKFLFYPLAFSWTPILLPLRPLPVQPMPTL